MPRVKFIYIGDGEWIKPTADFATCPHPKEKLRFDSRFPLPIAKYCTACGRAYLHPFHGWTEQEIIDHKTYVKQKYGWMFEGEDDGS